MDHTGASTGARVALVTGGSRGLGRALARALVDGGWRVLLTGRDPRRLQSAVTELNHRQDRPGGVPPAVGLGGDVADGSHRSEVAAAVRHLGRLDLLVNNASELGASPLPRLAALDPATLTRVLAVNVVGPLDLFRLLAPLLERSRGRVVDVTSDAALEAYAGWGAYGGSKAALDLLTAVLALEHPRLRAYAFDPGDMATELARQAFPDEDLSARPAPSTVVPALLRLVQGDLPSGRYRVVDLAPAGVAS